mgnify:CR=1 FL=1
MVPSSKLGDFLFCHTASSGMNNIQSLQDERKMMVKKTREIIYIILITALALFSGLVGCSSTSPQPADDISSIRAYADPATETALRGLSESDLAKYIQYGNAAFKAAVTPEIFNKTAEQVRSQLGAYELIEFLRTETQQDYVVVHYKAKFEKGEVGVRMVFDKDHLVAGQWFE